MKYLHLLALLLTFPALNAQPAFTLEDIFVNRRFEPRQLPGLQFINDRQYLTQLTASDGLSTTILLNEVKGDEKRVLFDSRLLGKVINDSNLRLDTYTMIDTSRFLISRGTESIYRYSSKAEYYYVDVSQDKVLPIFPGQKIMYPAVSPDGSKVAFVADNDLYFTDLSTGKLTRLTVDGKAGKIINGASDWVYEEEFNLTSAFKWSPDSRHIAFLRFDESEVKKFGIDYYYGGYPQRETFKYPRAGEKNSVVTVWIMDVLKKKAVQVPITAEYIPRIKWRAVGELGILSMNRFQNEMDIHIYLQKEKRLERLYREEDKRYMDLPICFEFMADGSLAISSEKSGWQQLYILDRNGREMMSTDSPFEMESVKQINLTERKAYMKVHGPTIERSAVMLWDFATGRYRFVTDTSGSADIRMLGQDAFMQSFHSQDVRNRITLHSPNYPQPLELLNDERLEDSILGKKIFMDIPLEGRTLKAWMLLPPNFDSSKTYPAIFYVYGGPGDQRVVNAFPRQQILWLHFMAQMGFVVVSVDNRGTGARGADFRKMTYMKLGQLETEDQLDAAEYIAKLPFVDGSRMGIFGWSYGGYMSLMALMQDKKMFKAAVSVAPVTHWKFYDTVYTERYMRTPVANPTGYEKGAPLLMASKMEGELLLIHGTADDNVHYQHSMELIRALVEAGKQFRFLAYPNKDHGIGGTSTRMHLFKAMTDFFVEKL